ncbi:MAG TPA: helix-turn-helix domain-containing protein [Bryobacteraceae bacterium]|nr:helix-turn-helix domain-containing protein [Bryobacteraceae bacterium]
MLFRHYLAEGLSKRAVAGRLGVSRRTVTRWIHSGDLDRDLEEPARYGPRPPVPTKLDPYKAVIQARLDAYPKLSSVRLLGEIRSAGYAGGYTQLKEYVRSVRPRPPEEPVIRFETAPGRQVQVDFADFKFPWGRRYALMVVLGYSRLLWVRFFTRKDMRALLDGLEEAFANVAFLTRSRTIPESAASRRMLRLLLDRATVTPAREVLALHCSLRRHRPDDATHIRLSSSIGYGD